jgi:hypothetical protein
MATEEINDQILKTLTATTDELLIQETAGGVNKKMTLDPLRTDSVLSAASFGGGAPNSGITLTVDGNSWFRRELDPTNDYFEIGTTSSTGVALRSYSNGVESSFKLYSLSDDPSTKAQWIEFNRNVTTSSVGQGIRMFDNTSLRNVLYAQTGRVSYFLDPLSIGSGSVPNGAIMAASSTTLGFAPPRMTTAERDLISPVSAGVEIYNLTTNKKNFYNGSAWEVVTSV